MDCIVVNGKGGCGKDTFCDVIANCGAFYPVIKVSSIDPVKEVARYAGWDGVKDEKGRKFLSDLKLAMAEYNDYSNRYCLDVFNSNINKSGLIFVHIREPEEIKKFVDMTGGRAKTLLIRTKRLDGVNYGNVSDDSVENYDYDYVYDNDCSLEDAPADMIRFLNEVFEKESELELPHEEGQVFSRQKDCKW